MRSFIEYVATEEKIPTIPKKEMKVGDYQIRELDAGNYNIDVLTTKQSAINYFLKIILFEKDFPPMDFRYFLEHSDKTKEDWERQWKECYEEVINRDADGDGSVFLIINGKSFNLEDVTFDEFVWITKNLNKLEFFSHEAGWGDTVFGGVIQPLDPYEEDEESNMHINTQFDKWVTDDKYLIKKVGKTEVVYKDKVNNITYIK